MAGPRARVVLLVVSGLVLSLACRGQGAQCTSAWVSCGGPSGVVAGSGSETGVLAAIRWDPDGAGPATERAVFGGNFTSAGGVLAKNIVQRDLTTGVWSPLGSGITGVWPPLGSGLPAIVRALAVLPNGELVAGGSFNLAGGVSLLNLARWNGTSWAPVDSNGIGGTVRALALRPNGSLVVAGGLVGPGGQFFAAAEWSGSSWTWHGGYSWAREPCCVRLLPNGNLLAGTSGIDYAEVVVWNGTSWSQVGATFQGYGPIAPPWIVNRPCWIRDVDVLPNGALLAGGAFSIGAPGNTQTFARWNGATWGALAVQAGSVASMRVEASGQVVLAGATAPPVQVWNGSTTAPLGTGLTGPATCMLSLPNGDLLVTGDLQGGAGSLMLWDGVAWSSWTPILPATDVDVRAIGLLAGGGFVIAGLSPSGGFVSRRQGNTWQPIFGLPASPPYLPTSLLELANGDLLVGGTFGGALLRWDGAAWSPVGYPGGTVRCLARAPNGDVLVAGSTAVRRWDGTTWTQLGGTFSAGVLAVAVAPNGDVYAGGDFTAVGALPANRVARWDGASWSPLGGGIGGGSVLALAFASSGTLVAGGTFTAAGGAYANKVARWDGSAWSAFSGTPPFINQVRSIVELPGGDLAMGGDFGWLPGPGNSLARWNGSAWQAMGSGFSGGGASVHALAVLPNGDLAVGGDFTIANGLGASKLVLVATTCHATAVPGGAGCAGSGGANTLVATALPWTGGTFRAQAGGMPAFGLFAAVFGFAPLSQPLSAVLPQGLPGCSLLATPDLIVAGLPSGGMAATALAIPYVTSLAGLVFHHQVVAIELDVSGAIVALSSTPSLVATIGVY